LLTANKVNLRKKIVWGVLSRATGLIWWQTQLEPQNCGYGLV